MVRFTALPAAVAALLVLHSDAIVVPEALESHHSHHHKHHHKHHHGHHHHKSEETSAAAVLEANARTEIKPVAATAGAVAMPAKALAKAVVQTEVSESTIMNRLQALEHTLDAAAAKATPPPFHSKLEVNAPLPMDFDEKFSRAVALATGADAEEVKVTGAVPMKGQDGLDEVDFQAPKAVAIAVLAQASDPSSKLANGPLHSFLVARSDTEAEQATETDSQPSTASAADDDGIKTDMQMPYGDLEPFGREDTAQELTESSIKESDEMVDQLERAEVAEEKRAVFRALTRLRGAAITSFDGVARAHTGNIDEFARKYQWRKEHPIQHLAHEESDISKWAFPDHSD